MNNHQPSIVVVGAGFAGAATAFHLARMGMERVTILEQEEVPGMHASGRNAAMVRQVVPYESIAALARGGAAFLRNLPRDWPLETHFEQNGSFLLASATDSARLKQDGARSNERGVPAEWWPIERIVEAVPILEGSPAAGRLVVSDRRCGRYPRPAARLSEGGSLAGSPAENFKPAAPGCGPARQGLRRPNRIRRNSSRCGGQRGRSLGPTDRSIDRGLPGSRWFLTAAICS